MPDKQPSNRLFGLSNEDKQRLLKNMKGKSRQSTSDTLKKTDLKKEISNSFCRFDQLPGYYQIFVQMTVAEKAGIANPFFKLHDGIDRGLAVVNGKECISFGAYNYLDYCGDPRVSQAAKDAIDVYGTSVSASRVVSGDRQIHRDLEQAVADMYGVESCVVFVSGHATNVTTIGHLFGPRDLIVHDSLVHNSILVGSVLSGADRRSFPHNDLDALDQLLTENRHHYERVLIVVEGLYSMDGDYPDLPRLIEIKKKHKVFLMVDEAHSMGTMGTHGRGLGEFFGINGCDVDLWMGTFSKTFASCGGYIAGEKALVDYLKFTSPGFLYSVGMSPPVAGAALKVIELMQNEQERIEKLHANAALFLSLAQEHGLSTGLSAGIAVVPVIIGSSAKAAMLSNQLYENGINVPPIVYPAVEERAARLRFFLSSAHTEDQIKFTIETVARELANLNKEV